MPRRAATPEHLQASLRALPPDSPHSNNSDPGVSRLSIGPSQKGAAHWTLNAKEKPALPRRPSTKSVSLKLSAKAAGGPTGPILGAPAASPVRRSCSAEVAWAEFSEHRQPPRSAGGRAVSTGASGVPPASAPQDRSLAGLRVDACQAGTAAPPRSAGAGRPPLPSEKSSPEKSFSSTAPAVVDRPPAPTRPSPGKHRTRVEQPVSSPTSAQRQPLEDDDEVMDTGRVYAPVVAAPLNSIPRGGARGRGADNGLRGSAANGSTPAGKGGGRGRPSRLGAESGQPHMLLKAPGAVAPVTPGGDKLADVLAGFDEVQRRPMSASAPSASPSSSPQPSEVGELPYPPRVAWPESAASEEAFGSSAGGFFASLAAEAEAIGDSSVAEMAAQIRRDQLERLLLGAAADGLPSAPSQTAAEHSQRRAEDIGVGATAGGASGSTGTPWVPRTADARTVLEETEKGLAEASARHEARKHELSSFLDDLRRRVFEAPRPEPSPSAGGRQLAGHGAALEEEEEERLVSLPADFDDLVDLNAQLSHQRRGSASAEQQEAAAIASGSAAADGPPASSAAAERAERLAGERAAERLRLPEFLEKRIADEAREQDPRSRPGKETAGKHAHNTSADMALPEGTWGGELADTMLQINRLDSMLLKREAAGAERVRMAQREVELTRERLKQEEEEIQREKIAVLQRLKERGLMKSGGRGHIPGAASRKSSAQSSTLVPSSAGRASASSALARAPSSASTSTSASSMQRLAVAASLAVEQYEDAGAPALMDWSGWTTTVVASGQADDDTGSAGMQLVPAPAPPAPSGAEAAGAAATDADTSTFQLTSTTTMYAEVERDRASEKREQEPEQSHMPRRSSSAFGGLTMANATLATVAEVEAEGDTQEVADDPYAADQETIDSLIRIDEKLQRIVPEQEWEAKSISSVPSWRPGSEAVGGDNASQGGHSVWSRAGSVAPGDPVLREQFESREAEKALVSIDDQLRDIQFKEASKSEAQAPDQGELKQLLLQAAQEAAPLDTTDKVLALTGQAAITDGIAQAKAIANMEQMSALVPMHEPSKAFPESACLQEAQLILRRLSGNDHEWNDALGEAQLSLVELEQDLHSLETAPALNAAEEPASSAEVPTESEAAGETYITPYVQQLEDLSKAVADMLERQQPGEDLLAKLRSEGHPEGPGGDTVQLGPEQEGYDVADDDDGLGDQAWRIAREEPDQEVARALDIDLPAGDGVWDDAELERVVRAVNGHFGDVPADFAKRRTDANGNFEDGLKEDVGDDAEDDEDVDWGESDEEEEADKEQT
mmetsp:Transcript_113688/g.196413  ORF Transcript_113688/g.196413 Transcript_113688/m.196413 type:complete len:1298 (-) Transcript_113688:81-3974(-)